MIPELTNYENQPIQRRNNNLLCLAIILFMIGLGVLQGVLPIFLIFYTPDLVFWIMIVLFGMLPTLGGIYVMWKWWTSGS